MISVPLPFVVALLLTILFIRTARLAGDRSNPFFVALIAAYALQSVVIGIRWGYGIVALLPVQAVLAAVVATLAWLSFDGLRSEVPPSRRPILLLHALPTLIILGFVALWPSPIALALILIFLGYGLALTKLAWAGPDALGSARLDGVVNTHRALQVTAFAVVASAVADIVISIDFMQTGGVHSAGIVAVGNVIALLVLGAAASVAEAGQVREQEEERDDTPSNTSPTGADIETATALDALMREKGLYRDMELNLNRLARKINLPARQVSGAINRVKAMSVSQYVNDFRIKEACRLLGDTDEPVTRIMFDAGFQTKSNFNREFLRVTGMSPKAWRARHLQADAPSSLRLVG